jgi:hypothetical protein
VPDIRQKDGVAAARSRSARCGLDLNVGHWGIIFSALVETPSERGRSMGNALFALMWLGVALLATLGAAVALAAFSDLREKLSRR